MHRLYCIINRYLSVTALRRCLTRHLDKFERNAKKLNVDRRNRIAMHAYVKVASLRRFLLRRCLSKWFRIRRVTRFDSLRRCVISYFRSFLNRRQKKVRMKNTVTFQQYKDLRWHNSALAKIERTSTPIPSDFYRR